MEAAVTGFSCDSTPTAAVSVIGGPFGYANGLALSADERYLFMVESDTDRVYRFDLTSDGQLGPGEVYADSVGRLPDGLALDEAGNLYVACYASDEIWRISPSREKTLLAWDYHAILLSRPTNLAWGVGNRAGSELGCALRGQSRPRYNHSRAPARRARPAAGEPILIGESYATDRQDLDRDRGGPRDRESHRGAVR